MPTSFDNEVNILIGGVAPNHALRSALGTDHLIFEYEFFFSEEHTNPTYAFDGLRADAILVAACP